jgi:hypothetical protein
VGLFGIGLPSPMETFVGRYHPISIEHPASWVALETPQGNHGDLENIAVISVPGRSLPSVIIAVRPFPGGSIENVIDWGADRASQRQGYQLISLVEHSALHNYYWVVNSLIYGTEIARCMDWHILKNNTGYVLSFCANQDHWLTVEPVFHEMIQSFLAE